MSNEPLATIATIATIVTLILLVFLAIVVDQKNALQEEAVDKGFAEWVVKNKNSVQFKWKDSKHK